jgi:hypothetical protein
VTPQPHASLHLGLSAEAMLLIDPQLEDRPMRFGPVRAWLLRMLLGLVLLLLLPGAPIVRESGLGQLAKAAECASRCSEPPLAIDRPSPLAPR